MAKKPRKLTEAEVFAAALTQIYIGIAMARAAGLDVSSPYNVRMLPARQDQDGDAG